MITKINKHVYVFLSHFHNSSVPQLCIAATFFKEVGALLSTQSSMNRQDCSTAVRLSHTCTRHYWFTPLTLHIKPNQFK